MCRFNFGFSPKIGIKNLVGLENYKQLEFFFYSTVTKKKKKIKTILFFWLLLQRPIEIWRSSAVFRLLAADVWISSRPERNRAELLPFPQMWREVGPRLVGDLRSWKTVRTSTERHFLLYFRPSCCCPSRACWERLLLTWFTRASTWKHTFSWEKACR